MEKTVNPKLEPKVTIIFPTKNEATTIERNITVAKSTSYKPSVIVVDGHSTDDTRKIAKKYGATVVIEDKRIYPGKGYAMKMGIRNALRDGSDIIVFMDADIQNLTPDWIDKVIELVVTGKCDMARGTYLVAPLDASVTKLVAKPLLRVFFPEISYLEQPLTGEVAAKAEVWKALITEKPPDGWGIDVWLLIEAVMHGYRISETFLGEKVQVPFSTYESNLAKLSKMSEQVALAIFQEAIKYGRTDNVREASP